MARTRGKNFRLLLGKPAVFAIKRRVEIHAENRITRAGILRPMQRALFYAHLVVRHEVHNLAADVEPVLPFHQRDFKTMFVMKMGLFCAIHQDDMRALFVIAVDFFYDKLGLAFFFREESFGRWLLAIAMEKHSQSEGQ